MSVVGVESGLPDCLLRPGNTNCGGCGMSISLTMFGRALGGQQCSLVIPACCGIVTAGAFPTTSYGVPVIASTFASAPAFASGVAAAVQLNGEASHVVCWAGDGGTYDIGMATLSAAAERNENLIYVCYDNEIYGNTGGQRSSATPVAARTSTTPGGKAEQKKTSCRSWRRTASRMPPRFPSPIRRIFRKRSAPPWASAASGSSWSTRRAPRAGSPSRPTPWNWSAWRSAAEFFPSTRSTTACATV
jgi:hypothetical protein